MDVYRIKILTLPLLAFTLCALLITFPVHAASRGITVKAKTSTGTVKEIQLYSGYHALVVGCGDYDFWPDLPNAVQDARKVAVSLRRLGFQVNIIENPNSLQLKKAINDLAYKDGRETDRALLFYYAGHGETEKLADGTSLGYIIPKDCPLLRNDPEGFVNKAISMKDIEAYSLRIRSKHVLMLFDSCFSGSLFSLVRAVPQDISEKSSLPVRQYITAGTENETVPDRSMFKRCLLIGLEGDADLTRDGYITGSELGMYLSDKVIQNTHSAQHPQYGKIRTPELSRGDFIFKLSSSGAVTEKPTSVPSEQVVMPGQTETALDDILKASEDKRKAVESWNQWQQAREHEYQQVKKIDEDTYLSSEQKAAAWQRFLAAVAQDNPYSQQDDEMRTYSRSRLNYWQNVKPSVTKPDIPEGFSGSEAQEAGRDGTFIAYATGVVYDKNTELEWYVGPDRNTNWNEAKAWVESLNVAGGGWRMPTRDELRTLNQKGAGTRNMAPLLKTTGWWVWSGETRDSSSAWPFFFLNVGEHWPDRGHSTDMRGFAVRSRRQ